MRPVIRAATHVYFQNKPSSSEWNKMISWEPAEVFVEVPGPQFGAARLSGRSRAAAPTGIYGAFPPSAERGELNAQFRVLYSTMTEIHIQFMDVFAGYENETLGFCDLTSH